MMIRALSLVESALGTKPGSAIAQDLIAVVGNPLADLRVPEKIDWVMVCGHIID